MSHMRLLLSRVLVAAVVALALISHHAYTEDTWPDKSMEWLGYTLLLIAAGGRIWASAFICGRKSQVLVTGGPYSIMRHPLYFFSMIAFIGAGLAFEMLTLAVAFTVVFFVTHWGSLAKEERRLRERFPIEFAVYEQRVPRFLPNPALIQNPSEVAINPRIFGRAVVECMVIASVFGLAELSEWGHLHGALPIVFLLP